MAGMSRPFPANAISDLHPNPPPACRRIRVRLFPAGGGRGFLEGWGSEAPPSLHSSYPPSARTAACSQAFSGERGPGGEVEVNLGDPAVALSLRRLRRDVRLLK